MADDRTQLPDAADLDISVDEDTKKAEEKVVALWQRRFTHAENFRRPYHDKNIRMYKLYRAYRESLNYAYGTNIMPPIGFEIIETIKPRLASAKVKVTIGPTKKEDINSKSLDKWDDLVSYDLQVNQFDDMKIQWINAMLLYGNSSLQFGWQGGEDGDPYFEIVDNELLYVDPRATNRLLDSRWEIKQAFKSKAVIERAEKDRGENPIYTVTYKDPETGEDKEVSIVTTKKWKDEINDEQPTGTDPRRDRYEVNTLKMGQIDDGRQKKGDVETSRGTGTQDKDVGERVLEIWECWDHVENKLQVIFNRKHLVRDDENPYLKVRGGRVFIDLVDIALNWEYYALGHLEPVETTIHEIADSRNQAMDDIVFSLDPIRKVKKGQGYKPEDLKHSPGAIWYLNKADDVVIEKPPEVSRAWVEKDALLRREIQTSLALSEYTQGIPKSNSEPANKVELLLTQTNVRFSLNVRQLEIAMTDLVNACIQLNQEFLGESKAYRLVGDDFRFEEFTGEDKKVIVDAWVDIAPLKEKSADQEGREVLEMYKLFIVDDKPEPSDVDSVDQWKRKKQVLQKLIVEKLGYEEYADVLAPEPKASASPSNPRIPQGPPAEAGAEIREEIPGPEELLPPEAMPEDQVEPVVPEKGFLSSIGQRIRAALPKR